MKMSLHYVKMPWPIHRSVTWNVTHTGRQTNAGIGNKVIHLREDVIT